MTRSEHLLACLAEECDEVGQRCMKALRFGLDEIQPGQPLTNAERIVVEYYDLLAVVLLLREEGILPFDAEAPVELLEAKQAKVEKFMRYAEEQGALQRSTPAKNHRQESDIAAALLTERLSQMEHDAKICEAQAREFLAPQYATGQPLSSLQERFACGECARTIRNQEQKP